MSLPIMPHNLIKDKLVDVIERTFQREGSLYIACNDRNAECHCPLCPTILFIKDKLVDLIERNFQREGSLHIACNDRNAFFTSDAVRN